MKLFAINIFALNREYMRALRGVRRNLLSRSAADGLLFVSEAGPPAAVAANEQQDSTQQQPAGGGSTGGGSAEAGSGAKAAGSGQQRRPKTPKMDHLVCFLPGTLALGHLHGVNTGVSSSSADQSKLCQTGRHWQKASRHRKAVFGVLSVQNDQQHSLQQFIYCASVVMP